MTDRKFLYRSILIIFCVFAANLAVSAQKTEDEPVTRSINSLDFQTQRPATVKSGGGVLVKTAVQNPKRRKSIAVLTNPKRNYKWVKRNTAPKKTPVAVIKKPNPKVKIAPIADEQLGVTFWRLRPPKGDEEEDAPTFDVNTGDGTERWTAERVRSTTKFKIGDRVRFTIEASRDGFLYLVNREFYTDGSRGEAKLVYPTLKSRGRGDNSVVAGSVVDLPSKGYFRIKPQRDDYAGEEVIVIISPVKLPAIKLGLEAIVVPEDKVETWVADWGTVTDIYDATDGEGIAVTRTENEAVNSRALVQEEPTPQTIYKTQTRSSEPLLIAFQLQAKTPDD